MSDDKFFRVMIGVWIVGAAATVVATTAVVWAIVQIVQVVAK